MDLQDVLVAEDEPTIRMMIEDALVEAGYAVHLASNGDDALALLKATGQSFAGLVTDIRMPGATSGWDLGRCAREIQQDTAIIYISADSAAEWSVHGVPESIFVQKPFAAAQIVSALSSLLNTSG